MKLYVVTAPEERRGIYETWEACKAAVHGVAGARYQSIASRAEAEAILGGEGVTLGPGLYAFVDGRPLTLWDPLGFSGADARPWGPGNPEYASDERKLWAQATRAGFDRFTWAIRSQAT